MFQLLKVAKRLNKIHLGRYPLDLEIWRSLMLLIRTFWWSGQDEFKYKWGPSSTQLLYIGCEPLKNWIYRDRKIKTYSRQFQETGWSSYKEPIQISFCLLECSWRLALGTKEKFIKLLNTQLLCWQLSGVGRHGCEEIDPEQCSSLLVASIRAWKEKNLFDMYVATTQISSVRFLLETRRS